MTKQNRRLTKAKETLQLWEKYLKGEENFQSGNNLPSHSILSQIQRMVDKDFMFRSFHEIGYRMAKRDDFKNFFSSNPYLIDIMQDWYSTSQCLYIRRITDDNKNDSCSLISLLKRIENGRCNINRELFCSIYGNDNYANTAFDILAIKNLEHRKNDDKISEIYIDSLITRLKTKSIELVRSYVDSIVAHSDFKKPEIYPSMDIIKECHDSILEVYKEISLNFFLTDSTFGEVLLHKDQVLHNINKPFAELLEC